MGGTSYKESPPLKWVAALDANDMNGLLADDMGLGKTVMTIAYICYLWETKGLRD